MLSKALLKKTIKDNWKFWLIFTIIMSFYLVILLFGASAMGGRGDAMGDAVQAGATNMMLEVYYSMIAVMLPLVYIIVTANKLIAAQVDKGSLSYVMANPIKRNQVSITQALYLIGSVLAMFLVVMCVGFIMIGATGINVALGSFMLLNLGAFLLLLALSAISYFASCFFNLSRHSLLIGAGIPIIFFLFGMFKQFEELADIMKIFKYLTINSLFNVTDILAYSTNLIWQFLILFGIGVAGYTAGVLYFKRKDLPL